jgi:AcrR family transcriptional regulator
MARPKAVADTEILRVARDVFLTQGASVSVAEIASHLGVSHTTLFNRFGSKEGLLVAALGVPESIEWVRDLAAGPDDRAIPEQLIEHGKVLAAYFQRLQQGMAILQAAGIGRDRIYADRTAGSTPARGFQAMVEWLSKAQAAGRLAQCDTQALATTVMGSLYNWSITAEICGHSTSSKAADKYVERFVDLLWQGVSTPTGSQGRRGRRSKSA